MDTNRRSTRTASRLGRFLFALLLAGDMLLLNGCPCDRGGKSEKQNGNQGQPRQMTANRTQQQGAGLQLSPAELAAQQQLAQLAQLPPPPPTPVFQETSTIVPGSQAAREGGGAKSLGAGPASAPGFVPHGAKPHEGQLADMASWQAERAAEYDPNGSLHDKNNWNGNMAFLDGRREAIERGYPEGATDKTLMARYHELQTQAWAAENAGDEALSRELSREAGRWAGLGSQWDVDHPAK